MNRSSIFILTVVLVPSCVIEENLPVNPLMNSSQGKEKIEFIVRMGASSTQDLRSSMDFGHSFGIFAFNMDEQGDFKEPSDFMDNVHLLYSAETGCFVSGNWDIPESGIMSFYAYSPYSADTDWSEGIEYVAENEISMQTELLYATAVGLSGNLHTVPLAFSSTLARISLNMRALPNESEHTVKLRSVCLGGADDGGHFYRNAVFDLISGLWRDASYDLSDPLLLMLEESHFNAAASALPADFTPIMDESVMVIPQDFTAAGLPFEVSFSIMDGRTVIMNDTLKSVLNVELRQGETCFVYLDLTPVPISFQPSVDSWVTVEAG